MADDGSKQGAAWPQPKFYFSVEFSGVGDALFQEVSGLDVEDEVIAYRAGNTKAPLPLKLPGIAKPRNVVLHKGAFPKGTNFWDWFNQIKMNTIKRQDVRISLLDEQGKPSMVWTLKNAFPTKITGTDLKAEGNEVAVESIELAHEGLTIENA